MATNVHRVVLQQLRQITYSYFCDTSYSVTSVSRPAFLYPLLKVELVAVEI